MLVPGRPSEQTLSSHNRSALYKSVNTAHLALLFPPLILYRGSLAFPLAKLTQNPQGRSRELPRRLSPSTETPEHAPVLCPLPPLIPLLPLVSLSQCLLPLCLFLSPTCPLPRVFVPSFTYRVSAQLVCVGGRGASVCPLTLRLRPKAPPLHNSSSVACGGASVCQLELALPPWGHWVYVRVETPSRGPGRTIRFQLCVRLQGQTPSPASAP